MKVMLIKDVYKLGRAGDIKKVADGYGRNFLIPQGLGVLATAGALKQIERIKGQAEVRRSSQNEELKGLAEQINGVALDFTVKAGETGKLYGSITTQDVSAALTEKIRYEGKRQLVDMQPIREIGEYTAPGEEKWEEKKKKKKQKPKQKKKTPGVNPPPPVPPEKKPPAAEAPAE